MSLCSPLASNLSVSCFSLLTARLAGLPDSALEVRISFCALLCVLLALLPLFYVFFWDCFHSLFFFKSLVVVHCHHCLLTSHILSHDAADSFTCSLCKGTISQEYSPGNEVVRARVYTLTVWYLIMHSCAVYIPPTVYEAKNAVNDQRWFFWSDGCVFLLLSFACWRKIFQLHFSVPPLSTPWDPYVGWNIWGCPIWVPCSLLPSCISVVYFCVALNNTEVVALPCCVLSIGSPSVCVWENFWSPSVTRK